MSKPTIQIHNIETGEIIEREMNAAELKNYNEGVKLADDMQAQLKEKIVKRQELLDKLGITANEAKLLLG